MRLEAVGDNHAVRRVRNTNVLRELVKVRANLSKLEHEVMHGSQRTAELQIAERRYRTHYAQLVEHPKLTGQTRATFGKNRPTKPKRPPKLT